ncbi:MerR family transcriptional regulator [Phycicoccus sp. CSK15P-2]|uniref:transcriptional regulator FtsR n=1 Tax=Phycicoccus sp. CSK15P-2 TaxID=2807627 RepID=UPI00194DD3B5|nr:MerR family transcriptional regulator [Phycicoccus sp. CSK15P-2]MBM6405759.1 MerR family transcriptional regulator [Phycicoccus sp. CSK15P-2]
MAPGRPLTIGAVVSALVDEFPDVTVSKVRFLEAEGLVAPERSGAGYRRYSPEDLERLRYVLRAQRDLFWPLKVIKEALAAADRGLGFTAPGERPALPEPVAAAAPPDASAVRAAGTLRLSADELAEASGLSATDVDALVGHGLLRPVEGMHGAADLDVARAVAGLGAFGVEPRHLRGVRAAADREVGLVEQVVGGRRGADAHAARDEVARLCLALHAALLRGGLSETS